MKSRRRYVRRAEGDNVGWIDVVIPGAIGLLLVGAPGLFFKPTGDPEVVAGRNKKVRALGVLLLVVAVAYSAVKLASSQ